MKKRIVIFAMVLSFGFYNCSTPIETESFVDSEQLARIISKDSNFIRFAKIHSEYFEVLSSLTEPQLLELKLIATNILVSNSLEKDVIELNNFYVTHKLSSNHFEYLTSLKLDMFLRHNITEKDFEKAIFIAYENFNNTFAKGLTKGLNNKRSSIIWPFLLDTVCHITCGLMRITYKENHATGNVNWDNALADAYFLGCFDHCMSP